ncbi:Os12g0589400 [Oryza sativa Japonica Group]|uniref:Expressed protein n=2 Tax=Oryza sativa subsp. japonica TaxID=39947 RepID=Q2QMV6_ORYSJ|nr:expressed protein [Oryza sativa Japonica Group]KAB8118033.1 hypothetical protein EE612_060625 [Oryza sativa]BAF30184.1 Os12g0589400 [Oryza sativa Japonica Group]BAT17871.1 Os12g0589400 [Oryza sativa Japonica Group]|eukprot:NP_001067165.1 Os12g0589400 [Oryza sativa Japonica Group]
MEAHGWMVLDRIVRCWSDDDDVVGGDDDPTSSEVAYTCSGHPIRVSLRVADPPAVSRLYVHRPGWPRVYDLGDAEAIAAHRGSILLSARVPFADLGTVAPGQFPVDYYVYTAGEGLRRPSLTRLPPCFIGGFSSPEVDRHFKPHRCQQQRVMVEQNVGFFCHGAGNFTVADINIHKGKAVELCVLNHYADCPQQPQWKVQILEMQQQPNQNHHLRGWWTDAVLPLHDSYLACVDCYHGIILIDVKTQRYFNYIPLPAEAKHGRRRVDKYSPDPARSASINSAGNITVVCIADDNAAAGGRNNNSTAGSAFIEIESWCLVDIHESRWILDFTMEAGKFWDICSAANQPLLPHAPPTFPLVSMANPFAISFLLYDKANNFLLEDKGNGLYWMIEVDMRNQILLSPATLYISEEEEELFINGKEEEQERCCDERYPPMKYFYGHNFIPSWFPSYLKKGGDTTRFAMFSFLFVIQKHLPFV